MILRPLLVALLGCTCGTPDEGPALPPLAAPNMPDLVLVTLDTTRADHLGAYGYPRDTSPVFDALAERAVLFERFVVPMATTLPTHTSLLTGTWPAEHGVLANVEHGGRRFVPSPGLRTFTSWLAGLGYDTAGVVSAMPLSRATGIARGFRSWSQPRGTERPARITTNRALGWLAQAPSDRPIFLWVHYYDPHNPYAPPEDAPARFGGTPEPALDAWLDARAPDKVAYRPTGERVDLQQAVDGYDGEIRTMDGYLGQLLDALDEARGTRARVLVVAGDHGEGLNQHGEPGHGQVWTEHLHAPLLVLAPGLAPRRVPTVTAAADVLPIVLGLVDLPGEADFLAQVSGADVLAPGFQERPVLSQTSERQEMLGRRLRYARTGPRWACHFGEDIPTRLYDHLTDPHELAAVDDPATAQACRDAGMAELAVLAQRGVELGAGRTVDDLTDAERAALEELGYLE
ncbi:MAG: sulfatase [Alphaproteobacteria bacterium]|nr:sulfatase [Alphaproteobacteria bacterium]